MNEKLRNHFLKLGPRRFVVGAVIVFIILDILNGFYLKLALEKNQFTERIVSLMIQQMKISPTDLDHATLTEMGGLVTMSFDFLLFVILLNNLFFYLFYLRKKLWAQGYVLFYALTAGVFPLLMIFDGYGMGVGWMLFNLLTVPVYFYLYMGVKLLKDETTLVPEKKGR